MKPEQQRIAIAEWCGLLERNDGAVVVFQRWDAPDAIWQRVLFNDGSERPCIVPNIPDYLNDLNAMHEAEELLIRSLGADTQYVKTLTEIASKQNTHYTPFRAAVTATAAQRAEALLRTIGKWTDSTLHTKG